jgi:DNA-binding transcriptional LysR family regulator
MDLLSAMTTFVRAVDTGSLSAAARSLPSSLTSVSQQVAALEEHFGTRLLLRTTRQLALTDEGRVLYERAKAVLGEVKEIEAALSRDRHQPPGRIRVASPSLMGRFVIAPLLAEFLAAIRRCRSISCWSTARSTWSRKTSIFPFASAACATHSWSRASWPTCA